jgi:hypothetical protein
VVWEVALDNTIPCSFGGTEYKPVWVLKDRFKLVDEFVDACDKVLEVLVAVVEPVDGTFDDTTEGGAGAIALVRVCGVDDEGEGPCFGVEAVEQSSGDSIEDHFDVAEGGMVVCFGVL